jgi:tetratricopeptide (TPR) repeat protein
VIYDLAGLESLLTIGSWSVIVFLFCRLYRRFKPQVLLLLAFVALRFLPLSQIIPIRSQAQYICIPDHFLYVPSVGLLALVVILFHAGSSRGLTQKYVSRTFLRVLVAGWIAFLCLTTIEQNIYATNEIAMDKRSVSFSPRHVRMNITLGLNYAIEGDFKNAQKYFQLALDYEPTNVRALIGLGTALLDQGQYWQGLEVYDKIASLGDFKELVDENKKLAYRILTEKYRAMQKAQPSNAEIYYSLGVVFAKNNEFEDAIGQFEKALELDPAHSNARLNLCNCYKAFGQMEKADQCFLTLKEK